MILALTVAALLQAPPTNASPPPDTAGAYLDAEAALMVAAARARTESANGRIEAYQMVAKQLISASVQALWRERLIFRQEIASRVDWAREGERRTEVLGARQAIPIALPGVRPIEDDDLDSDADLSFDDPARAEWLLRVPSADGDSDEETFIVHPLAEGSEANYRFRSGETTTIRLADGRTIRLVELQVLPRRSIATLLSGSLWLEADTYAAVRGVFSLAAPARFEPNARAGIFPIPLPDASFTLRYLTVEYGLWEDEWWLPRLMALEGSMELGRLAGSVVFEQSYEDYRIYATGEPRPALETPDTTRFRVVERECRDDTDCPRRIVLIPRDTALLLSSESLPGSIFDDHRLLTDLELRQMSELVRASSRRAMLFRRPRFRWEPLSPSSIHYNRVEGLTLGTRGRADLEPLSLVGSAWIGLAEASPSFSLGLSRTRIGGRETIGAYRRLEAFSPDDQPFSVGSSLSALAFGSDDGDYYRVMGAFVSGEQTPRGAVTLTGRAYIERQEAVTKQTDGSLPHWLGEHRFRDNPMASEADQVGLEARVRLARGLDPTGFRGAVGLGLLAERGTFHFARPSMIAFAGFPLPGPLVGAIELGGGTSLGELPVQRLWYVGGNATVRGLRPEDRISGDAFWRARAEVANDFPAARVVLFSDAGWAGERDEFTTTPTLVSGGVGVSFVDGLVRTDLARTFRGGDARWGLQLYLDAPL